MMNIDTRSIERYSHCLCLHVQPTSLIIGFIHLISSLLSIVLHFEDYTQYHEDERRMVELHRSTTTSLNMMVSLMMAIVSALLIYGVTKSRPSYLMPFFGVKLYIFFFSLPASISMLCFSPHISQYESNNGRTVGGEMKRLMSSSDPTTAYTSSIFMALIEFLYQLYFICVIWKCYRYLKLKESVIPLHTLPYHLRGVEITVPSEIVTTPSAMAPPDYETATKLNPPPDYDSAIKNYQMAPPSVDQSNNNITVTEPILIVDSQNPIRGEQNNHHLHHHNHDSSHLTSPDCHDNQLSRSGSSSEKCSEEKSSFNETTTSHPAPFSHLPSHNETNLDSNNHLVNNNGGIGSDGNENCTDNSSSPCDTSNTNTTS